MADDDPEVLVSSKVAATIGSIRASVDTYLPSTAVDEMGSGGAAFEEECDTFRRSMSGVADVLDDVKAELVKNPNNISAEKAGLDKPLELIRTAAREGGVVLFKCSSQQHKAVALVFTQQLMGTLDKARADVDEALRFLHFSKVKIHVATHRLMDSVSELLSELKRQIRASVARRNEVTDLLLLLHEDYRLRSGVGIDVDELRRSTNDVIRNSLVDTGAVPDANEANCLMAELRHEAESIRKAKVVYDQDIVDAVLALIAPTTFDNDDDNIGRDGEGTEATLSKARVGAEDLSGGGEEEGGGGTSLKWNDIRAVVDAARSLTVVAGGGDKSKLPSFTSASETNEDEEAAHPGAATPPDCESVSLKCVLSAIGVVSTILGLLLALPGFSGSSKPPSPGPQPAPVSPMIATNFLRSLPGNTKKRITVVNSSQYRAYRWLVRDDQVPAREEPNEEAMLARMTQRFALATLFYSINGLESWINYNESECEWGNADGNGVVCNADSQPVAVDASNTNVSTVGYGGTLPPELALLTALTSIGLYDNGLTSSIPTELGQLLALEHLDLGRNKLNSSIPTELGRLSALEDLGLFSNALTSTIPTELGTLSVLKSLSLGSNYLNSTIPSELGMLSALTSLNLSSNLLSSSIPAELGLLRNLSDVRLDVNRLTGTFPSELCYIGTHNISVDCWDVACTCCGCWQ